MLCTHQFGSYLLASKIPVHRNQWSIKSWRIHENPAIIPVRYCRLFFASPEKAWEKVLMLKTLDQRSTREAEKPNETVLLRSSLFVWIYALHEAFCHKTNKDEEWEASQWKSQWICVSWDTFPTPSWSGERRWRCLLVEERNAKWAGPSISARFPVLTVLTLLPGGDSFVWLYDWWQIPETLIFGTLWAGHSVESM